MIYIGKMYRPTKIYSLHDKRGLEFHHKYKSNFGSMYEFTQQIHLHFGEGDQEVIVIEMDNLVVDVLLDNTVFDLASNNEALSKSDPRKVTSLRNVMRPAEKKMSSKKESLTGELLIESVRNKNESEKLLFEMKPVVLENKEYLFLSLAAETRIQVKVNTSIKMMGNQE